MPRRRRLADEDDDLAEDTGEKEWSGPEDGPAYEIVDDNTEWDDEDDDD
ncbi:MAG TPA: hypothetical protein VFW04_15650 [Gemmatimonadaceae bacterium]|nr:hypothetical protein [Gemmatimonadaceae bacterium]